MLDTNVIAVSNGSIDFVGCSRFVSRVEGILNLVGVFAVGSTIFVPLTDFEKNLQMHILSKRGQSIE